MSKKRKPGRPPSSVDAEGNPAKASEFPKLTITMRPETKARLEAMRSLTREPAWKLIETALEEYFRTLPAKDRKALDTVADRIAKSA